LAELCSKGPFLEEDIAMTNISLDLLGRADLFLAYAGELEGEGKTADDLAYRRNERQYFNHLIVERPNNDFAHVMMRQFLSDALLHPLFTKLKLSKDERFAAIAEKGVKESAYHLRHSKEWIVRLAKGTDESRTRILDALDELWTYTNEMFEWSDEEKKMAKDGLIPSFDDLKKEWNDIVKDTFNEAGLEVPQDKWMATGGRQGIHSEYLGHMLGDMQYLPRAYPNDKW
jgi:ring-1,2-phenylacetyl-CoA epoxidase subunit PaaC